MSALTDAADLRSRFEDQIRYVPASRLKRNPLNWRTHPKRQERSVDTSLTRNGFVQPLLVRDTDSAEHDYELIDGELRADLAGELMVPVLVTDLDDEEAKEILLALDATAGMNEIHWERLGDLIEIVDLGSIPGYEDLHLSFQADIEFSTGEFMNDDRSVPDAEPPDPNRLVPIRVEVPLASRDAAMEMITQAFLDAEMTYGSIR